MKKSQKLVLNKDTVKKLSVSTNIKAGPMKTQSCASVISTITG